MVAALKPVFYFAYAVRRLLGADGKSHDFADWRAVALFMLVQVQILSALVYAFFRPLFFMVTPLAWAIGAAIPILAVTYLTIGNRRRYLKYARWFDSWSKRKRVMADIAAGLIGTICIFSNMIVKETLG